MQYTSLKSIQLAVQKKEITVEQIVANYLRVIDETRDLNIYVEIFKEEALAQAKALDLKYENNPNDLGKLYGAVISIKDVICIKGKSVTAGSKILEGFESVYSATVVEKLISEDAIIIGSVNCDEFAMGSSNENSVYGPVKNPLDSTKIPGGSSGGSAASVAANTCLISLGSDTGGSVRQPAAFCGVVGMKPTYGRISRHGLLAYASSFDQIGILANNVSDAATVLEVISGADEYDSTVSDLPVPDLSKIKNDSKKYKIAYLKNAIESDGLNKDIKASTNTVLENLKNEGHLVEAIDFPLLDFIIPTYYVLTTAEASTNLSRYDGIRYGYRSESANTLEEVYKKSRTEGFGNEVKRRIILGTFVLSAGYFDAYFSKAQKVRRLISEHLDSIFEKYDFLIMPTTPDFPWTIGEKLDDPVSVYLSDIYTVLANLGGIPAISLPVKTNSEFPTGIQVMSNKFTEEKLLKFSKQIESSMKN